LQWIREKRGDKVPFFITVLKEIVENIIKAKLEKTQLFLVDIVFQRNKIEIYIDGDAGVSLEDCAVLNRHLHNELEKMDIDAGKYIVEISSPGLDRNIREPRGFKKNVGRNMRVKNKQNRFYTGKMTFAGPEGIILQSKKNEIIKYSEIEEAKAVI